MNTFQYPRSVNGQNSPLIVMMCYGTWIVITFNTSGKQYRLHHWTVNEYMSCLYQGYPLTFRHLQASSHLYHCHLFCIGYGPRSRYELKQCIRLMVPSLKVTNHNLKLEFLSWTIRMKYPSLLNHVHCRSTSSWITWASWKLDAT